MRQWEILLNVGLCSSRGQWFLAPNFCSWMTRNLIFFIQIICWAPWILQGCLQFSLRHSLEIVFFLCQRLKKKTDNPQLFLLSLFIGCLSGAFTLKTCMMDIINGTKTALQESLWVVWKSLLIKIAPQLTSS